MEQPPAKVDQTAYYDLLSRVVDMTEKATRDTLTFYWELGASVNELEGEQRHRYGDNTIETFAEDLQHNGIDLGTSSLYKAATFNKNCSKENLQRLIKGKWSWRNAVMLFSNSTKPDIRKDILSRVEIGEISQDKTRLILKDNEPVKTIVRGLSYEADNLIDTGKVYSTRLESIADLAGKLKQLPIAERRNHQKSVHKLKTELEELLSTLKTQLKTLDAIKF
jgi:hypothetical protein